MSQQQLGKVMDTAGEKTFKDLTCEVVAALGRYHRLLDERRRGEQAEEIPYFKSQHTAYGTFSRPFSKLPYSKQRLRLPYSRDSSTQTTETTSLVPKRPLTPAKTNECAEVEVSNKKQENEQEDEGEIQSKSQEEKEEKLEEEEEDENIGEPIWQSPAQQPTSVRSNIHVQTSPVLERQGAMESERSGVALEEVKGGCEKSLTEEESLSIGKSGRSADWSDGDVAGDESEQDLVDLETSVLHQHGLFVASGIMSVEE